MGIGIAHLVARWCSPARKSASRVVRPNLGAADAMITTAEVVDEAPLVVALHVAAAAATTTAPRAAAAAATMTTALHVGAVVTTMTGSGRDADMTMTTAP